MAKTFASASSLRMDSLNTGLGNWEYTQAFSVFLWHKPASNTSGQLVGKQEGSGNFRGWGLRTRAGTTSIQYALTLGNTGANECNARTTNEFANGTWRSVCWTSSGAGTVAGCKIYVNASSEALTTITDALGGNTIINTVTTQVGCRGGSGAPGFFVNGDISRVLIYNVELTGTNITNLHNGALPTTISGLQCWLELSDLGATIQPDWSENGNVFSINFAQTYLAGGSADLTPSLGTSGAKIISGPLTRNLTQPILQNLGWAGGANTGVADQIAPGAAHKADNGDYRGWFENDTGGKSLDVGNQPGAFDFDTPTIYGTSSNGSSWTLSNQNVPTSALFRVTNLTTNPSGNETTMKAALQGESSISSILYDPDDAVWKCWFHGGNNSGTRKIYYAICSGDPAVAGNWVVQNSGSAVLSVGGSGTDDETLVADGKVLRINSSLMVVLYLGRNASSQTFILHASSTDRGLTWTKNGRAISPGSAGSWDASIVGASFIYDAATGLYCAWYGGALSGTSTADGIGLAYSANPTAIPFTKGVFNPVLCKQHIATGVNNFEYQMANTIHSYKDGITLRHFYRADNGVGGTTAFRGRCEAFNSLPDNLTTFVNSGAAATGSTSLSIAYPTGLAAGDLLVCIIANKYPSNAPSVPSGWTQPTNAQQSGGSGAAGIDTGTIYCTVFVKNSDGTESGNLAVTITSGNSAVGRMFAYRPGAGKFLSVECANGADNSAGTGWSVTAGTNPGVNENDILLIGSAINSDNYTFQSQAVSATGTNWDTAIERQDSGTNTGQDSGLVVSEHRCLTGPATAAPVFTMTGSSSAADSPAGASVFVRIRGVDLQRVFDKPRQFIFRSISAQ